MFFRGLISNAVTSFPPATAAQADDGNRKERERGALA